jgi:ribulose 1,5-bisphosphate carboxylase large subunit-like protein
MDRASRRSRDKDRLTTRDKEEAINIIRRRSRNEDRITNRDIESASSAIKGYKSGGKTKKLKDDYFKVLGVFPTVKKKMGGGMMQRPMGYTSGGKANKTRLQRKPEGIKDDTFDPIMKKPEGMKKELAIIQTEDFQKKW